MASPTSYKKYAEQMKNLAKEIDPKVSRFNARFRIASGIQPVTISGVSESTADAYFAALRVTLAYSAIEALELAITHRNSVRVIDLDLSREFRLARNSAMLNLLARPQNPLKLSNNEKELAKFLEGDQDDVRCVAFAIRNLMSHGSLTANRLQLTQSVQRRKLIHKLADAVLNSANERFTQFVVTTRNQNG